MAFKDIVKVLDEGKIRIEYKDKGHSYWRRNRENFELPEDNAKAWGKATRPKGVTTLMGETLEQMGLQQWPKNVALRELFGYYGKFTVEDPDTGEPKTLGPGFSKGVGTLWDEKGQLKPLTKDEALSFVQSAANGCQRKQKKGADIGSVVHDAIEHYVRDLPFDIAEAYMWGIKESTYESDEHREQALEDFDSDVASAKLAYEQFVNWWETHQPELLGAEDLVYSKTLDFAGTFDGLIKMDGKTILCDWKTSNSYDDGAPQGVSYTYFIQSAAYAYAWEEMGNGPIDDLLIVSARKDGGFNTKLASEVGLNMEEAVNWWRAVVVCFRMKDKVKKALIEQGKVEK